MFFLSKIRRKAGAAGDLRLQGHLAARRCDGCEHQCPLSKPQCKHGKKQAAAAAADYGKR